MDDRILFELVLLFLGVLIGRRIRASRATMRAERAAVRRNAAAAAFEQATAEMHRHTMAILVAARGMGLAVEAAEVGEERGKRNQE